MLTVKELKEIQEYCGTLSMVNIRNILNQLLYEYKQYIKSGTPEECAQRKEWMQMSYEDIMANFNSIVDAMRKEVADIKTETAHPIFFELPEEAKEVLYEAIMDLKIERDYAAWVRKD